MPRMLFENEGMPVYNYGNKECRGIDLKKVECRVHDYGNEECRGVDLKMGIARTGTGI
jgi:hypothetical protein